MWNEHNLDIAERWLAGEREAELEAALRNDGALRAYVTDVEKLRVAAAALEEDTAEPPARIWLAVRAQLASEGIIRAQEPVPGFWTEVREGLRALVARPALVGAYALVLAAAMGLAGLNVLREQPEFSTLRPSEIPGPPIFEPVAAQTGRELERRNPEVAAEYRNNLAIVDNFISLCEKTVREQPENTLAREYLYSAYQQKADLLAAMVERSAGD